MSGYQVHVKTNDELTTQTKKFLVDNGFDKYDFKIGVLNYPIEKHSKSYTDNRQYYNYQNYNKFIDGFDHKKMALFQTYTIGIYIKTYNLWMPLLKVGRSYTRGESNYMKLNEIVGGTHLTIYNNLSMIKLLRFPIKFKMTPRKKARCVTILNSIETNNYCEIIDKHINLTKLIGKL